MELAKILLLRRKLKLYVVAVIWNFSVFDCVVFFHEFRLLFSGSIADSWKLVTFHLNCKYYPWGLINDMQLSIHNRKHWHALSHSLHFVRHEGRLATHPPSPASKSGSRLPIFNSVCLGLVSSSDWFPISCYNVINNNTQEWLLYFPRLLSLTSSRSVLWGDPSSFRNNIAKDI